MGVDHIGEVGDAGILVHEDGNLVDHVAGVGAEDVGTEDSAFGGSAFGFGGGGDEDLHETFFGGHGEGAAVGAVHGLEGLVLDALGFAGFFGEADHGGFGSGEDGGGDIPATPVDPRGLELLNFSAYGVMLNFDIENKGTNGEYLNPNNLYWRTFIDKSVHEFTPDEYPEDIFDEPMTEIPYYFNGYYDIGYGDTPTQRFFVFYRDSWTRVGVQAVYKVGDETFRSRIVFIDSTGKVVKVTDGIDTVLAPTADTQGFYDLQGRRRPAYHSPSTSSLSPSTSSLMKGITIVNGRKVVR